ncbi:MAG: FAD-binding domain-containing protein [Pseudomonadota bacterium]
METLFDDAPAGPGLAAFDFTPTRDAARARVEAFAASSGVAYARTRNFDFGPDNRSNISALSPYIRCRAVTETEALAAALSRHSYSSAEKFVQEVFWRGYFKGWLEHRPEVWADYVEQLRRDYEALDKDRALRADWTAAVEGATGVDCFDAWAEELARTGYLHNHARMWFASIWIFTLRLPWRLGADYFMRHLLDGDPASNTLSWRWVGGLHTAGKTYLARADNIAKYTDGRFAPVGLADNAPPLTDDPNPPAAPLSIADAPPPASGRWLRLVTEEDLSLAPLGAGAPAAVVFLNDAPPASCEEPSPRVRAFRAGLIADAKARCAASVEAPIETVSFGDDLADRLREIAEAHQCRIIASPEAPVGPVADALSSAATRLAAANVDMRRVRSAYDAATWPYAKKGFFGLKKAIPSILPALNLV